MSIGLARRGRPGVDGAAASRTGLALELRSVAPTTGAGLCGSGWGVLLLVAACSGEQPVQGPVSVELAPANATLSNKQFSSVRSPVRELADGRVLLSDVLERALFVVDFESDDMRTIGSVGEGPGEYQSPGSLYALDGDSTMFTDPATHRALLLVGDDIVKQLAGAARLVERFGAEPPWGTDRTGRLLGVEGFAFPPDVVPMSRTLADSVRILLTAGSVLDEGRNGIDTIAELGGQGLFGVNEVERSALGMPGRTTNLTSPLASEGQAWLFRDGWIALAHPDPYRVDWRTPAREWIRGASLPFTKVEVTREAQCAIVGELPSGQCRPELWPWPEYLLPFTMDRTWTSPGGTALQPGPDGMLLIARTHLPEDSERRYDVVDRQGALRGVIHTPPDQTIVGFGRSSLYVVQKDDLDLLTLSRHSWPNQLAGSAADPW